MRVKPNERILVFISIHKNIANVCPYCPSNIIFRDAMLKCRRIIIDFNVHNAIITRIGRNEKPGLYALDDVSGANCLPHRFLIFRPRGNFLRRRNLAIFEPCTI